MGRWKGEGGRNNGANIGINFVAGCHAQKNIEGGQVMGEGTNGIAVNWGVLKWYSSWCCPGGENRRSLGQVEESSLDEPWVRSKLRPEGRATVSHTSSTTQGIQYVSMLHQVLGTAGALASCIGNSYRG